MVQTFTNSKMNIETVFNTESEVIFLMENFSTIIDMFSENKYGQSKKELMEHSEKSSRKVFGDDFFMQ